MPACANTYDKTLLGLAFYNSSLIRKKVNYLFMPMFSTGRQQLRGTASVFFLLPLQQRARLLHVGLQAQQFERYRKLAPAFRIDFTKRINGAWEQVLQGGYTAITEQDKLFAETSYTPIPQPLTYQVSWLRFSQKKQDALQGLQLLWQVDQLTGKPQIQASGLAVNQAFSGKLTLMYHRYYGPQDKVRARLFAGRIFTRDPDHSWYRMGLSSSLDYQKEHVFLDRSQISSNLAAFRRQTDGQDGGFRNYLPVYSSRGLLALNLDADLPVVPLGAYLDLGLAGKPRTWYYGSGFNLSLVKDYIQIYLPIAGSNYAQHFPQNFTQFKNNIRFLVNLQAFNPFDVVTDMLK